MPIKEKNNKDQVRFIDKFFVPAPAKREFYERMQINRQFIKSLPGFIKDEVYVNTDDQNNLNCITIALWDSLDAVTKAKERVQAEYKRQGFDIAEMMKRLNIKMERRIYKDL
jgi:heme-degrading monooxygenase HmoA